MGVVHFSTDLVEVLKSALPLEMFVATGTFKGDGVQKVRSLFHELYTVESSAEYYERFKSDPAIHPFHDTSANFLRKMMPRLGSRSILIALMRRL
jgi:hypothetical protein